MTAKSSMNEHIDKTVKRYSALFTLPSHRMLLIELVVASMLSGVLVATTLQLTQPYGLVLGLVLGVTFLILASASDFVIHFISVNVDPVFSFRRCTALSVYALFCWLGLSIVGVLVNRFVPEIWFKFLILGFCAALALRLLVFLAASFASLAKIIVFAGLQPSLYLISVAYTASRASTLSLNSALLALFILSTFVTVTAVCIYIYSIDRVGLTVLGVRSFSVLKAFMANWTADLNAPFERLFERFSQESEIQLSAMSFRNNRNAVKATMIVPAFHPGPFKNVGSSALPYLIQKAVEDKFKGCIVMVPHGLSGHNLDLATQAENQLVLERTLKLTETLSRFGTDATPFLQIRRNGASVGCQVFNGCALLTLTLAPETMEDLPPELNHLIIDVAKKGRLAAAIAVDAHNSINGPFRIEEVIESVQEAALASLEKAGKLDAVEFHVGVAHVTPTEFGLKEGMGPGGIIVLVVKTGDQTTAYVTIDGNNMITELREKILAALAEIGISGGEVFTTDTHMVNAVVLNARGYHPVGEAMNHEILISYVKQATMSAVENLEPAEVAWATDTVPKVKVIGEQQIAALSTLLDKSMKRARNLAISIFPIACAVLAALLLLL